MGGLPRWGALPLPPPPSSRQHRLVADQRQHFERRERDETSSEQAPVHAGRRGRIGRCSGIGCCSRQRRRCDRGGQCNVGRRRIRRPCIRRACIRPRRVRCRDVRPRRVPSRDVRSGHAGQLGTVIWRRGTHRRWRGRGVTDHAARSAGCMAQPDSAAGCRTVGLIQGRPAPGTSRPGRPKRGLGLSGSSLGRRSWC